MPTVEWNKCWAGNLKAFQENKYEGNYYGDHWGDPEEREDLKKVVADHLAPFVKPEAIALEIGSGGGRWTQYLLSCQKVFCVDLNAEMFGLLEKRFPQAKNLVFVHTSGTDLPGVDSHAVDFVFSFGTLVHCDVPIIESYLRNLRLVMKTGARAVLQFSNKNKKDAAENPGFANTTPEIFSDLAARCGYKVLLIDDTTLSHSTIAHISPNKD